MKTTHQYLDLYPIDPESEKLIVGTIHPHDHTKFQLPFFYGNKLSLWQLLSDAFPEELQKPISLNGILQFLRKHRISMSDTLRESQRKNPTALDQDLIPIRLNTEILEQLRKSNIREIFFTSGFQKNSAFKMFYCDMLGLKITPEIRKKRELMLDAKVLGRPIKLHVLYSPSGSSNIAIAQSNIYQQNKHRYADSSRPVYDFKVDYYRNKFS